MLGVLAFSQVTLALAACAMDRGDMAQMVATQTDHECGDDVVSVGDDDQPMSINACFLQSTYDLQAPGASAPVAISSGRATVLFTPQYRPLPLPAARGFALPAAGVPPRILLHSFLI